MRMEGHARTWFTPKQKAELWERWKSGQCVADIARALERRNKSGVYRVLAGNGGIAPAPRRRALVALQLEEREEISRGIAAGRSIRRIAQTPPGTPSFAQRDLWNVDSGSASLRLDVEGSDDVAPLLGFVGDELAEVGGRCRKHRATKFGKPRL